MLLPEQSACVSWFITVIADPAPFADQSITNVTRHPWLLVRNSLQHIGFAGNLIAARDWITHPVLFYRS